MASNDSGVVDNGNFQCCRCMAMSSETLEIRPTLLYSDMEALVGLPLISKQMMLNDLEWLIHVKFYFAPV